MLEIRLELITQIASIFCSTNWAFRAFILFFVINPFIINNNNNILFLYKEINFYNIIL